MNKYIIFIISIIIIFTGFQTIHAQSDNSNNELILTDEEKIVLFSGFSVAVISLFLFLARDIILGRKTSYDKGELESKKDKTFEKYHSDWGEDYEELGQRKNTKKDKEFREAFNNNELPDYYKIIGVNKDATPEEIKKKFREVAKKIHPDKTKEDSEEEMAKLNKAYEVLSDKELKEKYDKYFK